MQELWGRRTLSCLETINGYGVYDVNTIKMTVFPPSLKYLENCSITNVYNLEYIQFLGEYIKITSSCFHHCSEGLVIWFSNAKKLEFGKYSMRYLPEGSKLKIKRGAELVGDEFSKIQSQIEFIDESEVTNQKVHSPTEKQKEK